jgi:uronate dehydrogenase
MRTVLVTGASGRIATRLRPMLRARYETVILTDRTEPAGLGSNERFRGGELAASAAMAAACAGVDGILHLGGRPHEGSWSEIDAANVQGTAVLIEAARQAGVGRFVFASSNHVTGMYPRNRRISAMDPPRPDTRYGGSKAFGESLCALYADKHGMRCLSIRIGGFGDTFADARRLAVWIHAEDLFQLVTIGLEHPGLHNAVVFGCSDNEATWWDNGAAFALGYRPAHRAEDFRAAAMAAEADRPPDPVGDRLQGASFASRYFDGDLERTVWS